MIKKNNRSLNYDLIEQYQDYINMIIEYGKNKNCFIAFRIEPERISLYYKGRIAVNLLLKKQGILLHPRNFSTSKKEQIKTKNMVYKKDLEKVNLVKENKVISVLVTPKVNSKYIIDVSCKFLDYYYENKEEEKLIQNEIACKYQDQNKEWICIDQEYNQCFDNQTVKNESKIHGRYDFILLRKCNGIYKIVFCELKSNLESCKNENSGIINHFSDMKKFMDAYKKDSYSIKSEMIKQIEFIKKVKYKNAKIEVDYENPEFCFLFKMIKKEDTPKNSAEIKNIIELEIARAKNVEKTYLMGHNKDIFEKMKKNKVLIGDKEICKYNLDESNIEELFKELEKIKFYIDDFKEIK